MELNIVRLNTILSEHTSFVLYGCGEIAVETYNILLNQGWMPRFAVVTDKSKSMNPFFEDKLPVYEFKEKEEEIQKENIFMILAVNSVYEQEIKCLLQSRNINNYIAILDYDRFSSLYLNRNKELSIEECVREIAEWYIDSVGDYALSVENEMQKLWKSRRGEAVTKEKIIFVIAALSPRVIKIAQALQKKGYSIEIYTYPNSAMQEICVKELKNLHIVCISCKTIWELLYCLMISGGKVVHVFTHRGNAHNDKIVIRLKELLPPIVYDEYDIAGVFYTNVSEEIIRSEKYCLENTDGICNRGFEIEYLKCECDYHITAPAIQFQDYCSEIQYSKKADMEKLSVCYVGGILAECEYPDFFEAFIRLAEKCEENHCHFHVYPHVFDECKFKAYIELDKENEYFHLHKPVSLERLSQEISQYDYGVFPICRRKLKSRIWTYNTHEKLIYCTTNKYFDYLDAGLPIIAAHSYQQVQFFKKRGVILDWTVEDYDFAELRRRKKELKKKVLIEREKLKMSRRICELIELYDSL